MHLSEQGVDNNIQETTENFIPHQDRNVQVGGDDRAGIPITIFPDARRSKTKTNHVDTDHEDEKFPETCCEPLVHNSSFF